MMMEPIFSVLEKLNSVQEIEYSFDISSIGGLALGCLDVLCQEVKSATMLKNFFPSPSKLSFDCKNINLLEIISACESGSFLFTGVGEGSEFSLTRTSISEIIPGIGFNSNLPSLAASLKGICDHSQFSTLLFRNNSSWINGFDLNRFSNVIDDVCGPKIPIKVVETRQV
jgi:hypothetical protein